MNVHNTTVRSQLTLDSAINTAVACIACMDPHRSLAAADAAGVADSWESF